MRLPSRTRIKIILKHSTYILLTVSLFLESCSGCRNVQISSKDKKQGFITSPNYPKSYPPKLSCRFNFTGTPNLVINIVFLDFDLEPRFSKSGQCLNDYVLLIVTDRDGRKHVGERFCGDHLPPPLRTMQSNIELLFVSSYTSKRRGFKILYEFIPEVEVMEPHSLYFAEDTRWRKECGGRNDGHRMDGEIISPGFPETYPRNVTCNWLVRVNFDKRIYIRVIHLELSATMAECDRASLFIIDGYRHDETALDIQKLANGGVGTEMKFCGSQGYYNEEGMKSYLSMGNRVIIRFATKDSPTHDQHEKYEIEGRPIGFKLLWTEVNDLVGEGETSCDGFTCQGGEFCIDDGHNICASRTRLCINRTLQCNGISNCAENDNSDEYHCYSHHITILIGSIVLLLLICTIILIIFHRVSMSLEVNRRVEERRKPPIPQLTIIDEEPTPSEAPSDASSLPPPIGFKPTPPPIGFRPLSEASTSTIIQRRIYQPIDVQSSPSAPGLDTRLRDVASAIRASAMISNIDHNQISDSDEPVWRPMPSKSSPQPPKVRLKQLPPIMTPQPDRYGPYEDEMGVQSALV